jgi:hypothetical protein
MRKTTRKGVAPKNKATRRQARRARAKHGARAKRATAKPPRVESPLAAAASVVGGAVGRTVDAAVNRFRFTSDGHDALTILERDHRRLETLLAQGEDTTERAIKARASLLDTITHELKLHEQIEEQVLYPALKAHKKAKDIVLEGSQEHHVADVLIDELHALPPDDERWAAKFKVFKENVEHHIEEEEGEMFRIARTVLSRTEREALGERMRQMKLARH